jgi:tripartite-type tricarboxylate transporter receptor subunit TctC
MPMIRLLAALALLAAFAQPVSAQPYPSKPIRLIVAFAAGGGTDITARIIVKKLGENLGQQVVVDNRPGGGGILATELLTQAPKDGYTILLTAVGPLAVSPHMQKVRYDVEKDLLPITMAVMFPNVLVVNDAVKARTVAEYVALAKQPGSTLAYGSSGVASAGHLAGELFKQMAKVDIPHIAYKGGGPAMNDLLGGQVPSLFASLPSALPHIKSGRIRALATTGAKRPPDLADVPTIAESGYPGYEASNWYAFVAPAGTPPAIIERLNAEIGRVLRDPEVTPELAKHGMEPAPGSPADLAAYIARESRTWAEVVKALGMKPE